MKTKFTAAILAVAVFLSPLALMNSCANSDQAIVNAVKTATEQAILHVPKELQTPLADWLSAAAKGIYSIDGTPTVNELTAKILAFIPQDVRDKYPWITTSITTTATFAYLTYGKSGLTSIGKGFEAGSACWITGAPPCTK